MRDIWGDRLLRTTIGSYLYEKGDPAVTLYASYRTRAPTISASSLNAVYSIELRFDNNHLLNASGGNHRSRKG